ncbi:hypothetical protein PFISCL1PPCAC_3112, partial [Pristionchus fissidentatus]
LNVIVPLSSASENTASASIYILLHFVILIAILVVIEMKLFSRCNKSKESHSASTLTSASECWESMEPARPALSRC